MEDQKIINKEENIDDFDEAVKPAYVTTRFAVKSIGHNMYTGVRRGAKKFVPKLLTGLGLLGGGIILGSFVLQAINPVKDDENEDGNDEDVIDGVTTIEVDGGTITFEPTDDSTNEE